jgi:methyl-accepting chemotaxis protein
MGVTQQSDEDPDHPMHNDIESRLAFMNFDARQRGILPRMAGTLRKLIDSGLDQFYAKVQQTPETARFFRDQTHISGAKAAQGQHWSRIIDGEFDQRFHDSVRKIGAIHARIGLEPRWYVGAYALILDHLLSGLARHHAPWRRLLGLTRGPSQAEASIALVKAALLDMELSISTYFAETQIERDQAIATLEGALTRLAQGDLASDLAGMPTNFNSVEDSFNDALGKLRSLISAIASSSSAIRIGSGEIAQASEDLARRTESNAASLEQTAASVIQIEERLKASAAAAARTVTRADQAITTMGDGRAVADEAVQAMGRVSDSAKGIDSVIEGMDKIAFQTRVLAMNAAVEAGRAGDAGRGFAVVADLVSALAMRSEEEAKRARDQLTMTQTDIVTAVQAVQKVDGALANISGDVGQVHELLATMAEDNQAQSVAISQISIAIGTMDQSTQQNAAMVEETSAAARNLSGEVGALSEQANSFKVDNIAGGGKRLSPDRFSGPTRPLPQQAVAALVRGDEDHGDGPGRP